MEISDEEVRSLSSAIQKRYGVDFTCYEIRSLKRRIIRIINKHKLGSLFGLWEKVLKDPTFVEEFTNEISVGLTSLFRDPPLWQFLRDYITDFFDVKNNSRLNIWHAGCSTGEEVYSMGIVLNEIKKSIFTHALATDMNTDSISTAKNGEYNLATYPDYSNNYKVYNKRGFFDVHVTKSEKTYKFNPDLIRHVDFKEHNLVTDTYNGRYDIIFCRNVLIYFDAATKGRILQQFYDVLNKDGLLIIGFFDSFIPFSNDKLFSYLNTDVRVLKKSRIE